MTEDQKDESAQSSSRRIAFLFFGACLVAGLALRIALAATDHGIYYPDELYQSLEQAHRLIFGYGFIPWEFESGARNWTFAGLCTGLMGIAGELGLQRPREYLGFIRHVLVAWNLLAALGLYNLARKYMVPEELAILGPVAFCLAAPFVYFSHRALGGVVAIPALVIGLSFVLPPNPSGPRWKRILGLSLIGFAVLLRVQIAVFCVVLVGVFLVSKYRKILAIEAISTFALWAFAYGLVDFLTWGEWYQSFRVYLEHQVDTGAADFKARDGFYPSVFWRTFGPLGVVLLVLSLLSVRRAPSLCVLVVAFAAVHLVIPHKEIRFIHPAAVLLCATAAIGASVAVKFFSSRNDSHRLPATIVLSVLILAASAFSEASSDELTLGDLGIAYKSISEADHSAYGVFDDYHELLMQAGEQEDLCGISSPEVGPMWTGGYVYLHRDVPFFGTDSPPPQHHFYNYVITVRRPANPAMLVASKGEFHLLRLPIPSCRTAPTETRRR